MIKYVVVFFFNLYILALNFNLLYGHIQGINNLLWSPWLIIKFLLAGNG
jgi:hypothetical protein